MEIPMTHMETESKQKNSCKDLLVLVVFAHGCDTYGKRSPDGRFREWAFSRELSRMIIDGLDRIGIDSIIVNPEDEDVKLSVIIKRANALYDENKDEYKDIILISPHVNAASGKDWSEANGWTCYVYNKASSSSRALAGYLGTYAYDAFNLKGNRYIPDEGYFRANFAVLRDTKMPAVLTENMFMTNENDVAFLESETGKKILTEIHLCAIKKYIDRYK